MQYYLDSTFHQENGDGLTPEKPWKYLQQANTHTFLPGDSLLLRCGSVWKGAVLSPKGSGTQDHPIVIDSYGEGAYPSIDCQGPFTSEVNATASVRLCNQSYWTIRHIRVLNSNPLCPGYVEDPLIDDGQNAIFPMRHGIFVHALYREGVRKTLVCGIVVEDVVVENLDGTNGDEGNSYKWSVLEDSGKIGISGSAGIQFWVTDQCMGFYRAGFDGVRIERCTLHNCGGAGIRLDSEVWRYHDSYQNVMIRYNNLDNDADYPHSCAGMYIVSAKQAVVEYNRIHNHANGQAFQVCDGGTNRYNIMTNLDGKLSQTTRMTGKQMYWDGMGVDVDSTSIGKFVIENNVIANARDGGFAFFNFQEVSEAEILVQNNICYNSNHFFYHQNGADGYRFTFKNNTFIRDEFNTNTDSMEITGRMHKDPFPDTYRHQNNVFYCPDQAMIFDTAFSCYKDCLYYGLEDHLPEQGFVQAHPMLNIPTIEELSGLSYDGKIMGTGSFCDTDCFVPMEGSPCYSDGHVKYGADPDLLRSGISEKI